MLFMMSYQILWSRSKSEITSCSEQLQNYILEKMCTLVVKIFYYYYFQYTRQTPDTGNKIFPKAFTTEKGVCHTILVNVIKGKD